jgi:superfamily II DNA or RNA helicase
MRALKALKTGKLQILIGSTILDVGVDVPAVGMVILAGGMKAEVSHRQRVGRGLRAKKDAPNVAFIVDFTDHWNAHTREHARLRQEIIAQTPGFVEGILPAGADFDFVGLGITRKAA